MNELEALKKTRNRWMRMKTENRKKYHFNSASCSLCQLSLVTCSSSCPWYVDFDCCESPFVQESWIAQFRYASTTEEAEIWQTAIIGMLEYLIEERKTK